MKTMTARERKIVAIGLLVAALALVWVAVANPILQGFLTRNAEREALLAAYARNQRLLAGVPTWRADSDLQRRTAGRYAIAAPSQPLAAELLRERVTRVVVQGGGGLRSVQDQAADARPGWVRVRADANLSTGQLQDILRRLQTEAPYVVVEYLSLTSERGGAGRLPLDVRLEVSARFVAAPSS